VSARRFLNGLTVVPGRHTLPQADLAARFRERLAQLPGSAEVGRMVGFVYGHSTIEARHLEAPLSDLDSRGWYRLVNEATETMGRRALDALFTEGRRAADCDGLVAVSSSFAGFPSLTRRLQQSAGFSPDAVCYDLTGLGCAGPTHGLQLADLLVARGACRNVCVLCVDAMATHGESRRHGTVPTMSQLVAHCLASDGAAAALVGAEPHASTRLSWRRAELSSRLWENALSENDFTASEDGQPFISVGKAIRTRLLDELRPFLDEAAGAPALFHPGGAALMRVLADAYPALGDTLALSSGVLRRNGNIGSASVLWVLDAALRERHPLTPTLRLFALGPGIVSTVLRLDGVETGR
jgi:alkylresorcinol/alkylpyrone synthase